MMTVRRVSGPDVTVGAGVGERVGEGVVEGTVVAGGGVGVGVGIGVVGVVAIVGGFSRNLGG
jgi:hypothetical protein